MNGLSYRCCWHCLKCHSQGFDVPVPPDTPVLNLAAIATAHHATTNPKCAEVYQGRWVEITKLQDTELREIVRPK